MTTFVSTDEASRASRREATRSLRRAIRKNNTVSLPPGRRLDVQARHAIRGEIVRRVIAAVDAADVATTIDAHLHGHSGSRSIIGSRAMLVVAVLAADDAGTQERTDFAATAAALPTAERLELGLYNPDGSPPSYRAWERQTRRFVDALKEGWSSPSGDTIDGAWLRGRLLNASVPHARRQELMAVALDGTPFETWAVTQFFGRSGDPVDPFAEGLRRWAEDGVEPDPTSPAVDLASHASAATVGSVGSDGRLIRSKDVEARTSWATGTNNRSGHFYTGREVHLAVAVRRARWAGDPGHLALGEAVPSYIVGAEVTPAGSDRGRAGLSALDMVRTLAPGLREVVADLGYTCLVKPEGFLRPCHERGLNVVMDYSKTQRKRVETLVVGGEVVVMNCGHLLHAAVPKHLRRIEGGPRREDDQEEWRSAMELYAHRAEVYRWGQQQRHPNGDVRFRCPFEQQRAANADLCSASISAALHVPQVAAPKGMERCCQGRVVRAAVEQLDLYQQIPYGTPAWKASYSRRNAVEGVNGQLETRFNFRRGFVKAFGDAAADFAVTAEITAYNLRVAESDPIFEAGESESGSSGEHRSHDDADLGKDEEPSGRENGQRGPPR